MRELRDRAQCHLLLVTRVEPHELPPGTPALRRVERRLSDPVIQLPALEQPLDVPSPARYAEDASDLRPGGFLSTAACEGLRHVSPGTSQRESNCEDLVLA